MGTWKTMDKPKEYGFGVAKKPDSENPNAPRLKGWLKATADMKAGEFYNFTLWTSRKEEGAYNIKIEESKRRDDYAQGSADALTAKQMRDELDDEIPF